jgi:hypothetical protein
LKHIVYVLSSLFFAFKQSKSPVQFDFKFDEKQINFEKRQLFSSTALALALISDGIS